MNIDFYETQIRLKQNLTIKSAIPDIHFGVNLPLSQFEELSEDIFKSGYAGIVTKSIVVDEGTRLERKKMYLKFPTGYLIELKGYPLQV